MPVVPTSVVKAQIDTSLKLEAEATLQELGLDMPAALRMFLVQVVLRKAIPFEISLPRLAPQTLAAIADSYAGHIQKAKSVDGLFQSVDDEET